MIKLTKCVDLELEKVFRSFIDVCILLVGHYESKELSVDDVHSNTWRDNGMETIKSNPLLRLLFIIPDLHSGQRRQTV